MTGSYRNSMQIRKSPSIQHLSIIKRRDEWETPPNLFAQACVNYHITPSIDVCATKFSKLCDQYLGLDHKDARKRDALEVAWDKDFFMNPPYSRIKEFMDYAFAQVWEHHVNALIITYSKTDTKWWHKYIEENRIVKTHFIKGRVHFMINGSIPKICRKCQAVYFEEITECKICQGRKFMRNTSPYPSVWIVVKPKRRKK